MVDLGPPGRPAGPVDAVEFDAYAFDVDVPELAAFRRRGADQREATIDELFATLARGMSAPGDTAPAAEESLYNRYRAHLHWRILQTLSFAALPLVAVGFAIADRRAASMAGPVAGIVALVGYNETLEGGERWVAASGVSPWLAMWPLFLAFTAAGVVLFRRRAEVPRGDRSMPVFGAILALVAARCAGAFR
jgi:lipopolysaccharide export LptBFGC system permease protein LptF